jgi:hypothetical protein
LIKDEFKVIIGKIYFDIDARFETIRSTFSPIGNFICNVVNIFNNTEICLINSGSLRLDGILEEGDLQYF